MHQVADTVHVDDAAPVLQRVDPAGELGDHGACVPMLRADGMARGGSCSVGPG